MNSCFFALVLLALLGLTLVDARRARPGKDAEFAPAPFKWDVCDGAKGAVIQSLSVSPSPVVLGANITVNGAVRVNQPFDSTTITSVAVKIQKQVFGAWVDIPCVDGVGSCTVQTNICDDLQKDKTQICSVLQPLGLPCQCPFAAGTYSGPSAGVSVEVPDPGISWLTNGNFYAKVALSGPSGEYACSEVYVSLTTSGGKTKIVLA